MILHITHEFCVSQFGYWKRSYQYHGLAENIPSLCVNRTSGLFVIVYSASHC